MIDLTELARDILNGDTLPFGEHGVYDSADWIDAAQQALDPVDQDFTDIRAMVAKEEAAKAMAASKELIELAYQYQADLRHPPTADSRERRLERIAAVLAKAGAQ